MAGPDSGTTFNDGRSYVEYPGGTRLRFVHPCGHTSTKDYSKGPLPKRMGEMGVRMMAKLWRRGGAGVVAPCPKGCMPGGIR